MEKKERKILKYSSAFKLKVVQEIEEGKITVNEARKLYNINGAHTIQKWIHRLGKNHLLSKVVRVESTDEVNKLKETEKEKQQLESALAQSHIKIMSLEKMIEIAERKYGIEIKKKFDMKTSKS